MWKSNSLTIISSADPEINGSDHSLYNNYTAGCRRIQSWSLTFRKAREERKRRFLGRVTTKACEWSHLVGLWLGHELHVRLRWMDRKDARAFSGCGAIIFTGRRRRNSRKRDLAGFVSGTSSERSLVTWPSANLRCLWSSLFLDLIFPPSPLTSRERTSAGVRSQTAPFAQGPRGPPQITTVRNTRRVLPERLGLN